MSKLTPVIVEAIERIAADATVLSVGRDPESARDLLVIGEQERETTLGMLASAPEFASFRPRKIDDAVLVNNGERTVGIAYQEAPSFTVTANCIADGLGLDAQTRPWSIGPWIPEAFAADLAVSKTLRPGKLEIESVISRFRQYPPQLQHGLMQLMGSEIAYKARLLGKNVPPLAQSMLTADICFAGIRYLHAASQVYFRGLGQLGLTQADLDARAQEMVEGMLNPQNYEIAINLLKQ